MQPSGSATQAARGACARLFATVAGRRSGAVLPALLLAGLCLLIAASGAGAQTNSAPTASNQTVTTTEDTAYTFSASDFNFSDTDTGDALSKVKITTLESAGDLELDGVAVTRNQEISKADIDADKLTFTPAANANNATATPDTSYATFQFKVNDGAADSASAYTMTISVTAVNDAPTVANTIPDHSVRAWKAYNYTIPTNTFADVDNTALTYTVTLSDGADLPTWLEFDDLTLTLLGTPQLGDIGMVTLRVTAGDGTASVYDDFTLTVTGSSGAPAVTVPNVYRVPAVLGVNLSGITDPDGVTNIATSATYQWVRTSGSTDADITGATSSTYTLAAADVGKKIKVKVSFTTDRNNPAGPLISAAVPASGNVTAAATCTAPTLTGGAAYVSGVPAAGIKVQVGRGRNLYGYVNHLIGDGTVLNVGGLSPDTVTLQVGGQGHRVNALYFDTADRLTLGLARRLPAAEQRRLSLHVCDTTLRLAPLTPLGSSATSNTYRWGTPGIDDWDDHAERTVWLSRDAQAPSLSTTAPPAVNGATLTLTFDEDLETGSAGVPAAAAFTVNVDGTKVSLATTNPVAVSGKTVTLTLAAAVTPGQDVTVAYDKPATGNSLRDAAGNGVATIAARTAANNTPGVILSSAALTLAEGGTATYTVKLNTAPTGSVTVTPTSADTSEATVSSALTFTASNWARAQTVTVTGAQDSDSNDETVDITHPVSGYTGVTAGGTVRVTVEDDESAAPVFFSAAANGTSLVITFTETLAAAANLANSAFTVKKTPHGGSEQTVNLSAGAAPAVSGATVTLTLAAALSAGDTGVKVSYAKPSTDNSNRIEDAAGNETDSFTDRAVTNNTPNIITITADREKALGKMDTITWTLTRGEPAAAALTATVNFTLPAGNDWNIPASKLSRTVSFTAGSATATFRTVLLPQTFGDRFGFSNSATTGGKLTAGLAALTGHDTSDTAEVEVVVVDGPAWRIEFENAPYRIAENGGRLTVVAVVKAVNTDVPAPSDSFIVGVRSRLDTAINGEDFVQIGNPLTFRPDAYGADPDGRQAARVRTTVSIINDMLAEPEESFTVEFTKLPGFPSAVATGAAARVSIEDDDFGPLSVAVTSTPSLRSSGATADDTYGGEEAIEFSVTFKDPVSVTGTPQFEFLLGTGSAAVAKTATYARGSGTAILVFAYTVVSADTDTDGIAWAENKLSAPTGSAIAKVGDATTTVLFTHPAQGPLPGHKVHGTRNPPPVFDSATANETSLVITFNEPLAAAARLANSSFKVKKTPRGGSEEMVALSTTAAPVVSGATVRLTLAEALVSTDTLIKVSYTQPTTGSNNRIKDSDGNQTRSFTDEPVDNITSGVIASVESLTVTEGSTATYTVKLNTAPPGNITVTPASADTAKATVSGALTFTTGNWNTAQPVTVTGTQDTDANDETVDITHAVTGYGRVSAGLTVKVTVDDDETNNVAAGAPAVTAPNVYRVPAVLGVDLSGISDGDGKTGIATSATYQWVHVTGGTDADVAGATRRTYNLTAADVGRKIKVKVSFTDDAGNAEGPLTSAAVPATGSITRAATCAAPTLTGGAVLLDLGRKVGVEDGPSRNYGYSGSAYGSLDNATFTAGNDTRTINLVAVDSDGQELRIGMDAALSAAERKRLSVHVCDAPFRFAAATVGSEIVYAWAATGLDWSTHAERTIWLSRDAQPPSIAATAASGTTLTLTFDEDLVTG